MNAEAMQAGKVTLPCGCIVTSEYGHVHTLLCKACLARIFKPARGVTNEARGKTVATDWLDIGD
jgi:hypothetical protein